MSNSRIIAVVGATGSQGGGLVRAILADPSGGFRARAITRKASGDKAAALRKLGAEVVEADLDNEASLAKAFEGAYGAFCVTNYWEHMTPAKEVSQARNMAQAAKAAKLTHVVWSTLEDTRKLVPLSDTRMPTLMEKYKVPHFDAKGEADAQFAEAGVPTTYLLTTFYWENFIYFGMGPKKGPDGKFSITLPMGKSRLSGIAAEDIGKCAFGIFKQGKTWIGKRVGIAGDHVTGAQMAADMSKALGKEVGYNAVSPEVFRGIGFPGADDLGNMFQYYAEFEKEFAGARSLDTSRSLNPELLDFKSWLAKYQDRIPPE
ncbi:MAG TPA: NmrA/HSCARG family protein [Steroidobacteraceae bacterium]|nr:NmrA/HSCARG family protein [Steroidobacteraceae bacterium]